MSRPIPAVPMPLGLTDVWAACWKRPRAREEFEEACRDYHGAHQAFAVSSGRVALWLALMALKKLFPERTRVILPAYTCPTVGRAVQRAGLGGVCVDIGEDDFNIDVEQVAEALDEKCLAVIAPHMFGTPCDIARLMGLCQERGVVLIEDVAQACAARFDGRLVGTFGQLAFLSLGRSKNLRGYQGGVLLVNEPSFVDAVTEETGSLREVRTFHLTDVCKQVAISALSVPWAWDIAKRIPALRIGAEDQSFDDNPSRLAGWEAGLGLQALQRVEKYNRVRSHIGKSMEKELTGLARVHVQAKIPPRESVYVRLAVRLDYPRATRDAVVLALQQQGIDARAFYTGVIYGREWWRAASEQQACPRAEQIVATNVVLPIHYGSDERSHIRVTEAFKEALEG